MSSSSKALARKVKHTDVFSLSSAKTYLGRLLQKASKGEAVYIQQGTKRFILQALPEIEPIPMRPPGFFKDIHSEEEIKEMNKLAKASVMKPPSDLE